MNPKIWLAISNMIRKAFQNLPCLEYLQISPNAILNFTKPIRLPIGPSGDFAQI